RDRARSSSLSAAETQAGESSSPQGVRSPCDSRYQVLKSIVPLFCTSSTASSYTQCRGNGLAPTSSCSLEPSALIVSASVVHAVADWMRNNGRPLTRRGAGNPARPPTVCTKRTLSSLTSGSERIISNATPGTTIDLGPTL